MLQQAFHSSDMMVDPLLSGVYSGGLWGLEHCHKGIAALMAMMQNDDDDESIAEIEAMLQDARFQSWFKDAISKVKDIGKKAYSGIKKLLRILWLRKLDSSC